LALVMITASSGSSDALSLDIVFLLVGLLSCPTSIIYLISCD
jgi:hypothetical protein